MQNVWGSNNNVLEVHGLREGSGVQQHIQPRQINDKSSLLKLVLCMMRGVTIRHLSPWAQRGGSGVLSYSNFQNRSHKTDLKTKQPISS